MNNLHFWLVDDDDDDKELFQEAMESVCPDAQLALLSDGTELMDALHSPGDATLPDAIFLDLNMPLKGGRECLEEIRTDQRLRILPIIIYSTTRRSELIEETYAKGADFYISKPNSFTDLRSVLTKVCAIKWHGHVKRDRKEFVLF